MNPNTIFLLVMALACPIGMGLMMWMMNKNMSGQASRSKLNDKTPTNASERLSALYEQRQTLEAEMSELSRIAELEAQRDDLVQSESQTATDGSPVAAPEVN